MKTTGRVGVSGSDVPRSHTAIQSVIFLLLDHALLSWRCSAPDGDGVIEMK